MGDYIKVKLFLRTKRLFGGTSATTEKQPEVFHEESQSEISMLTMEGI
jgi:hypothetical protein